MRTIERSSQFKRDYRREKAGRRRKTLDSDFMALVTLLANDVPLPARFVDQALSGQLRGLRDCHLYPDLVLLYVKPNATVLRLVRMGSHSELGL
jgi:mRNA interferase YafQ